MSPWGYQFSTYAKLSENLTFCACAYKGVENFSFLGNFAYVLNV